MDDLKIDPFVVHCPPPIAFERPASRPVRFIGAAVHPAFCVASIAVVPLHW